LIRTASGQYFAQFSIGKGQRKGALLRTCATEEEAERRKLAIAKLVMRLRETGYTTVVANTIRDAGAADEEGMRKIARVVERIASGKEPGFRQGHSSRREGLTVKELAELWTSGDLTKQYPDHVRVKKTSRDDKRVFAWLSKVRMPDGTPFGERAVASVTLDDCDHLMTALPRTSETPSTRRGYAQSLRKLLVYGVYPLRLLPALPIPKGWLPKTGNDKAKAWIYPSEDLALMRCRLVPLARRVFYGLLVREGMRVGEALALTWADVDLERGVVRLDENKTDDPRSWALGLDVARALRAWKEQRGSEAGKVPKLFLPSLIGDRWAIATHLREGLTLAEVKRPELTEAKPGRMRRVLRLVIDGKPDGKAT
jgi:integrase